MKIIKIIHISTLCLMLLTGIAGCNHSSTNQTSTNNKSPQKQTDTNKQADSSKSKNLSSKSGSTNQAKDTSNKINTLKSGYPYNPPLFSGETIVRSSSPETAPSVIPNQYGLPNHTGFITNQYKIIDSWSGTINNKKFLLDIYRNKKTNGIVIGESYNGKLVFAGVNPSYDITLRNFTGHYFVFSYIVKGKQYQGWTALDLTNGETLPSPKSKKMSGCYPCHGGAPNYILGLKKHYGNKPIGD